MPFTIVQSQTPVQSKVDVMKKLNSIITSIKSYDKNFFIHEFTNQLCEDVLNV